METWCAAGCRYGDVCSWDERPAIDWDGSQALPRELRVEPETGALLMDPVPETALLRNLSSHAQLRGVMVWSGDPALEVYRGRHIEIQLQGRLPGPGAALTIDVLSTGPGSTEQTSIRLDGNDSKIWIDLSRSTVGPVGSRAPVMGIYPECAVAGDPFTMAVFVDGSIVEVFLNSRVVLTARAYPTLSSSDRVMIRATGADATLDALDVWKCGL